VQTGFQREEKNMRGPRLTGQRGRKKSLGKHKCEELRKTFSGIFGLQRGRKKITNIKSTRGNGLIKRRKEEDLVKG